MPCFFKKSVPSAAVPQENYVQFAQQGRIALSLKLFYIVAARACCGVVYCAAFILLCVVWNASTCEAVQRYPGRGVREQDISAERLLRQLESANGVERAELLDSLAWIYRGTDFTKAMKYAQQAARELHTMGGYPRVRAENNNYIGVIYRNLGDYSKAMEYFLEARRIAEQYGYRRELGYALNNIGDIHKYQRQYNDARQFVLQSLAIFSDLQDSAGLYYCHIRLGEIAQSLKEYPDALYAFRQALVYSQVFGNDVWKAGALNRIGQVYHLQGAFGEALESFASALAISRNLPNDEDEQALILIHIGKTYQSAQKIDSALRYLHAGLALAERIGLKLHMRDASKAIAEIYTAQRLYEEALRYHSLQMAMNDSLFSEASRCETERLAAKYELEKQQAALNALSEVQKRERLVGVVLMCGIVLISVVAVLLYRTMRKAAVANAEIMRQQRILEDQSTEIEMTNARLQEQNEELSALSAEKTELLNIVAHDLKNPIGAVRGLAELIEQNVVRGEKLNETAGQIAAISNRMLMLVTNVLDSNRLEMGLTQFSIVPLDILPIVETVCWMYGQTASSKHIRIQFFSEIATARALTDEHGIMQALDNLISNAVKYSPKGATVTVRLLRREGGIANGNNAVIRVEVQDEGPGISDEDKKKLFGKFARLSARPTGGEHSTGLGLSIVKKLVEIMHGRVWCESELGKGATFIMELPEAPPAALEGAADNGTLRIQQVPTRQTSS